MGVPSPESVWLRDSDGNRLPSADKPAMSPLAPEDWVRAQAAANGACVAKISATYPISYVSSGGEYGIASMGFNYCELVKEPSVVAAAGFPTSALDPSCYEDPQYHNAARDYAITRLLSRNRVRQETLLRDETLQEITWAGEPLYSLYFESYGGDRGRWNGWASYVPTYIEDGMASTHPSPEFYYGPGGGFTGVDQGNISIELTTRLLNQVGGQIRAGRPLMYS